MLEIPVDKIRDVIGTGGKTINQIIDASNGTKIDISDEGRVLIYHTDQESIDIALRMIEDITRVAKVGEIYEEAVINRIESYGIFVELFPGTDALVHVSDLRWERVDKPSSLYKMNDKIKVVVKAIDEGGKVSASIKELLDKPENFKEQIRDYSNNKIFTGRRDGGKRKKPAKTEK
jgi:polyribonucleotide nucleotidyltransferase